jgi:Signal recognition particle 9 kDa protein (SRP9)
MEGEVEQKSETDAPTKRAKLTVRTHDTASGATLWFHTVKAQEMSQVMRFLADLGSGMAGKERKPAEEIAEDSQTAHVEVGQPQVQSSKEDPKASTSGSGPGKKKKKGKGR